MIGYVADGRGSMVSSRREVDVSICLEERFSQALKRLGHQLVQGRYVDLVDHAPTYNDALAALMGLVGEPVTVAASQHGEQGPTSLIMITGR